MTMNVPIKDMGIARLGIIVSETRRKNRKITRTTRPRVNTRVNLMSRTDSRMDSERS